MCKFGIVRSAFQKFSHTPSVFHNTISNKQSRIESLYLSQLSHFGHGIIIFNTLWDMVIYNGIQTPICQGNCFIKDECQLLLMFLIKEIIGSVKRDVCKTLIPPFPTYENRLDQLLTWISCCWLVVLWINVDLVIFQPYLDLEAADNQSLKIQVARPGIELRSSCYASQELNHSATAAPDLNINRDHLLICSLPEKLLKPAIQPARFWIFPSYTLSGWCLAYLRLFQT